MTTPPDRDRPTNPSNEKPVPADQLKLLSEEIGEAVRTIAQLHRELTAPGGMLARIDTAVQRLEKEHETHQESRAAVGEMRKEIATLEGRVSSIEALLGKLKNAGETPTAEAAKAHKAPKRQR